MWWRNVWGWGIVVLSAATVLAEERPVDFGRQIRPVLSRNCFACHGPDEAHREGGLRLDVRSAALTALDSGQTAIVPGDAAASELMVRIRTTDRDLQMPPSDSGHELSSTEISLLERWISEGAPYSLHWSFVKPALHAVSRSSAPHPIDGFVRDELKNHGLTFSPEADRATLIRRVSLDLRGLPPSPEELDEFLGETTPDAYDRLVDRYLADPSFGERWARMWLDLARYADSAGYGSDPLRLNMWRYRNWVIDAFNQNMPYDEFTLEQLAGDLLPNATLEQKVATAFHRNTMTNTEGGTDDEEFRTYAIWDRTDTTVQVWMGLTMVCAKCHSHKYDPITQQEYYQVFAILNQTADRDLPDESPTMPAPDAEYLRKTAEIETQIAPLKEQLDRETPELAAEQTAWEQSFSSPKTWTTLEPAAVSAANGSELQIQPDQSILATGQNPAKETYQVQLKVPAATFTAIRLETIPDASLPGSGAGRADDGNFVLSSLSATIKPLSESTSVPQGRFVRIERAGSDLFIHLAEVEIFSDGKNIARYGTATQSTTDYNGEAKRAIDGKTNGDFFAGNSVTHTAAQQDPWWEVDLGQVSPIDRLVIWNRTDNNTGERMTNLRVSILDAERKLLWSELLADPPKPSQEISPTNEQSLKFQGAYADYTQPDYSVGSVVATSRSANSGWAVGPKLTEPHQAVFVFSELVTADQPALLTIHLNQNSKQPQNVGRFRLSISHDPQAKQRIGVPGDVLNSLNTQANSRTIDQQSRLKDYFKSIAPSLQPLRDQLATWEKSRPAMPTVPVMQELTGDQRRKTNLFVRGNFLSKGEEVAPGFPSAFPTLADSAASPTRIELALWLTNPENPLTARVAANRFWSQLFGAGIVTTEEDFGAQGELPSHPELLDWLAVEFQQSGWDMKHLIRAMATSAAYRQSTKVTPEVAAQDPHNRWLSRGPRFRLEAELVRDQALALSGLLSRKIGGPSVYPYQPAGMWQAAFNGQRSWTESPGEDKFRRGLYTFWRRTSPYPSMATFDAPSRETCALRRVRTNTPLQAFVTMNDPAYVEISQALARRIVTDGGSTPESQAAYALKLVLSRRPESHQIDEVVKLYHSELAHYQAHPQEALELATKPMGTLPEGLSPAEAAAWTVVANMLLNLDAVLMRG